MDRQSNYQRPGYYPPDHGDKAKPPRKPKRRLNPLRVCLLMACVGVFAFSAWQLVSYFGSIAQSRQSTQALKEVYQESGQQPTEAPTAVQAIATPQQTAEPTVQPSQAAVAAQPIPQDSMDADELWPAAYAKNPRLTISKQFLDLLERNEDIVGWLSIDGLVDEPVVQRDNVYYLTHNASGSKSVTGALFLDESCDLRTVSTQLVVHGHNMKEGAMFGSLKKYKVKTSSYFKEHPFITFNTLYEDSRYVIFAVLEADVRYDQKDYLPFWVYPRFDSAEGFADYIADVKRLSHYHCDIDVVPGDRLLTLSTCTGDDDNKRLLVVARRVRDNENMLALNTSILTTYDR